MNAHKTLVLCAIGLAATLFADVPRAQQSAASGVRVRVLGGGAASRKRSVE